MDCSRPLHDLLTYLDEAARLTQAPAFRVSEDLFCLAEQDLGAYPGVVADLELEGPAWLVVPRLQERSVPALDEELKPYVTLSASPTKAPLFKDVGGDEPAVAPDGLRERFEAYVQCVWQPWADEEAPRRKTMGLYRSLFSLHQALSGADESSLELVWGLGLAAWAHPSGKEVLHPLLTQGCFIELDRDTFALVVRPRAAEPNLELDCYVELDVPGVHDLESFWGQRRALAVGVNPFRGDSFSDVLRHAVSCLDAGGKLVEGAPSLSAHLAIGSAWVLYARKRSADVFVADVRRFRSAVEEGADIPAVVQAFVQAAGDQISEVPTISFRGLSSSSTAPGVRELCFPLPYNDEQADIVRKLESSDGVVVQGPPGTGKTHTIANVVSHYLAQGKRVLVTSKGDTALTVLRDKLPEGVRDLSVALLSNERAGMKQFEHAIQQIAARVAAIRPEALRNNIAHLSHSLARTHAKVAHVDAQLAQIADKNVEPMTLDGQTYRADELAQIVVQSQATSAWLRDAVAPDATSPWTEARLLEVRAARRRLGSDLAHLDAVLPASHLLVGWDELRAYRVNLLRATTLRAQLASGDLVPLLVGEGGLPALQGLLQATEVAHTKRSTLPDGLVHHAGAFPAASPLHDQALAMAGKVPALEQARQALLAEAVTLPDGIDTDEAFHLALSKLVDGKPAFALGANLFGGKKALLQQLNQCLVLGLPASTTEQWSAVAKQVAWRREALALIHRWNAVSAEFGLPRAAEVLEAGFKQLGQHLPQVADVLTLVHDTLPGLSQQVTRFFGADRAGWPCSLDGLASLAQCLRGHLELARLESHRPAPEGLVRALEAGHGALCQAMLAFLQGRMASEALAEPTLAEEWVGLTRQASRLSALEADFAQVRAAADHLEAQGLVQWAQALRTVPVVADEEDPVLPQAWRDAWVCRQAEALLDGADAHSTLRALQAQRQDLVAHLGAAYQELVAEQAWLGVHLNSTDKTKQALQSFLTSVQAMGGGTGLRAVRHRRAAREAMETAYQAVPCWILPQWRISEALPAEMGLFDLVVVDEASQSDISSLPAILRGKKLLVVGDHKQVSPSAVGVSETKILSAYDRLLQGQPHGAHMTADKSLYDLARVVFAGHSVMLKEHFRCVPAIIEYSNREFYNGEIRALRVPREHERLDPPLVDVYVRGGNRQGDKNLPEAEAILAEIQAILADPQLAEKTIGVVTLVGHEQAKLVHDLVASRISPQDILARAIVVGQPAAFQGRERDIMLVSMVLAPGDRSFSSSLGSQQRLNVALSRARDRTYLFRSVPDGYFPADSVSGRLLAHFKQPFHQAEATVTTQRERCESGFEKAVFDELVTRGYRVTPQVRAGGYRIDLVVEGAEGRRLAVECDGDRYHGAEKWADDMARQRVLERAGWSFWRCFASSFTRHRASVMLDLLATLDSMGIEPLGEAPVTQNLVCYREVDPMGVSA